MKSPEFITINLTEAVKADSLFYAMITPIIAYFFAQMLYNSSYIANYQNKYK
ncbi:hypothetical protein EC844_102216 [Acinetobacter calcoaceticus]|uniref:Uncharacterized protein n=1 Tax=Acinetobacter calcoaceticus TaxID=471 RepID=A0A4R1Y9W3_ACICA|nr:hypothetical protein EC844_102216 [Acinetobacter calcoaceticus]